MLGSRWFLEFTTDKEASLHYIEEILYSSQTTYQRLEIMRLGSYGKALILDGKLQSTESDEFIYHEALVHPSLITHGSPKKVLIAGGGEGATIREVLRHTSIECVYMIDLDGEVVEACKVHLPEWHQGTFDDGRVKVLYEDARKFIADSDELFDIIILDLPEPMEAGPAILLYTSEFYREVFEHLTPQGVMVTQATTTSINNFNAYTIIFNTIRQVFHLVRAYWTSVPSFYVPWGFIMASKDIDPAGLSQSDIRERIARLQSPLRYYNPGIHAGMLALPEYLKEGLKKEDRVNRDGNPLSFY
ncbi:spermidine synthase [bacterium BMS3Bbin06]|nr:spermidine synthase [bacterium BMS3Abin08]GBE33636.1 spermidine synthase [bacterium BMS3Bbin06]HDO35009.1 polyamine aminopropyltransferase [Nitrospirota bacterium]